MKKLLVLISAIALSATSAVAADLPARIYTKAPAAIEPALDWSGFYIGVNGGYAWDANNSNILFTAPVTGFSGFSNGFQSRGGFGGGQVGYNWQRDTFIFGVEADIQGSDIRSGFNVTTASNAGPLVVAASQRLDYFGTVRGRAGFAWNRTLFYATGGFAYGGIHDNVVLTNGGATAALTNNASGVASGYAVGGGVEHHFSPAWSAKAEYQYLDLGNRIVSGVSSNGVFLTSNSINARFQTLRVGLNYTWGGPGAAKY